MSLESMWNIVSSTSWMHHGTEELKVLNTSEDTSLIFGQEVDTSLFNELSDNLKGNLISPSVNERHGHIIKEDRHLFSSERNVNSDLLLFNFRFDRFLEITWSSSTREIDSLEGLLFGEFISEHQNSGSLSGTWTTN